MQGLPSLSQAMQVISSLVVNISLPKNIWATTKVFSRKSINILEWGGRHQKKTITHSIVIAIRSEIVPKDEDGMLVNPSDIIWEQVILIIYI